MMIFFLRQYLQNIPDALIESAKIDGANHFQIFLRIILPLLGPALAAQMIMWFMGIWNDYLAPYMFSSKSPTLPVVIASLVSFTDTRTETHFNMAASILSMLPVLAVYAIFQKQIIDSVILSGMKE
jgi:multiple sugar transport system permease protein